MNEVKDGDSSAPSVSDMDEAEFEALLGECLHNMIGEVLDVQGVRVRTFREARLLTHDRGVVVTFPAGAEFQVTIVRSRRAPEGR